MLRIDNTFILQVDGILPKGRKGPYPPCLRMTDRALLAGYPRSYFTILIFSYICFYFLSQSTVDKLLKKANLSLVVGTSSWREQFTEAITVSSGKRLLLLVPWCFFNLTCPFLYKSEPVIYKKYPISLCSVVVDESVYAPLCEASGYKVHCKLAIMCQNWAGIGLMLAASWWYGAGSGTSQSLNSIVSVLFKLWTHEGEINVA